MGPGKGKVRWATNVPATLRWATAKTVERLNIGRQCVHYMLLIKDLYTDFVLDDLFIMLQPTFSLCRMFAISKAYIAKACWSYSGLCPPLVFFSEYRLLPPDWLAGGWRVRAVYSTTCLARRSARASAV